MKRRGRGLRRYATRCIAGCLILLGGEGCSTAYREHHARVVTVAYLRSIYQDGDLYWMSYVGSDTQFHYIRYVVLFRKDYYRVPVSAWSIPAVQTFPPGHGTPSRIDPWVSFAAGGKIELRAPLHR